MARAVVSLKTVGIHPKLYAAVASAVASYLLSQEVLALPSWGVVGCQIVLVALAVRVAPAAPTVMKPKRSSWGWHQSHQHTKGSA